MTTPLRLLSRIRFRLLAFNALLVFLPAGGMLFLDTYEKQLLSDQERSMVEQGRVLAAALSGRGALRAEDVTHTLMQLRQRSGARIRVVGDDHLLLADSSTLGPRREPDLDERSAISSDAFESWLYRTGSLPIRLYREWFVPPRPPHGSADIYASGRPVDGSEVRAALAGRYGAATRISSGGQRSVTLYSAIPIRNAGAVVGAVLISQSTYRILQALYEVRAGVFRVFLASLAAAIVLSLLVSHTIARPLVRLRNQAGAMIDRRGRLTGRFEAPERRDEIGDLARTLELLRRRLEDHIVEVESFAGDVSHEFRNPLASIRTAADMLLEVEGGEERKRFVEIVQREVARMERMLSAVREIGRLDARAEVEDGEPVELSQLLEAIVEAHRLRGGGAVGIRSRAGELWVFGSPERLAQAFVNVLDNAASFSSPGAPIEIEVARRHSAAVVRVLDRGPGIPETDRERIFDRFFSYRAQSDSAPPHDGLGLAIAKAIVENAGGSIRASDRIGGGACFEIRLPLDPGRSPAGA